jgi:hypothetical protein
MTPIFEVKKLSETLPQILTRQRSRYVELLIQGVREGVIEAVPLEATVSVGKRLRPDHLILNTERFQTWHRKTVQLLHVAVQGVKEAEVTDEETFRTLSTYYRHSLMPRKMIKKLRPGKAAAPAGKGSAAGSAEG